MGRMPHKPPANYGYYIRLLQGLAAMIDKDDRIGGVDRIKARGHVNTLTIILAGVAEDPKATK